MRLEKKTLSKNPDGSGLYISEATVIHNAPSNIIYEEVWVYVVNPNDHPVNIILQVTGILDELFVLPIGRIPYHLMTKSLDPNDSITILTKEKIEITGFVNRSTKN